MQPPVAFNEQKKRWIGEQQAGFCTVPKRMNRLVSRADLINGLARTLRGHAVIRAAWLGGSDAFGRADERSDLDLCIAVDDASVEEAIRAVEAALTSISPIAHRYRLPQPTWHGHEQVFYRLRDAEPTAAVDLVVFAASRPNQFRERERHGSPVILFDPDGLATSIPLDRAAHDAKVRARLDALRASFPIFEPFVPKELERGRTIDALAFYHSLTLRPLIELLRIVHCPDRFDYGLRYLQIDLPEQVYRRLEPLAFVGRPEDLRARHEAAGKWFRQTLMELDQQR